MEAPRFSSRAVNTGRPVSRAGAAAGAVTGALRAAWDSLAGASMLLRGSVAAPAPADGSLVDAWRAVATAKQPPQASVLHDLCCRTLAGWGSVPSFYERVLVFDAAGYAAGQHPGAVQLPRPLLKAVAACVWKQGGAATARELSLVAVRCRPFLSTPGADLAVSILDAAVYWAAKAVRRSPRAALELGPLLGMAPFASRTAATQGKLVLLRQAAIDAQPRDHTRAALAGAVGCIKAGLRCDSETARTHVAARLARDAEDRAAAAAAAAGGRVSRRELNRAIADAFSATFGIAAGIQESLEEEGQGGEGGDTALALQQWQHAAARAVADRLAVESALAAGLPEPAVGAWTPDGEEEAGVVGAAAGEREESPAAAAAAAARAGWPAVAAAARLASPAARLDSPAAPAASPAAAEAVHQVAVDSPPIERTPPATRRAPGLPELQVLTVHADGHMDISVARQLF